jgi:anti-anti-sigma factor
MPKCLELAPYGSADEWRSFEITVDRRAEELRVRVMGDLDIATTPELKRVLDGLADEQHDRLLLDLDDLQFMDASGLRAILSAHRSAQREGNRITICNSSDQVHRLFEVTNLLNYLTFR